MTTDHTDTNARVVNRVDRLGVIHTDPKRTDGVLAKRTPEGFLRVDARLTRVGVFRYADHSGQEWGELRTEEEVFNADALRSFEMVVLTNDHPDEFVTEANVRDVQIGHVGSDVRRDGDFVAASILVTDAEAIREIEAGKVELSCGYTARVVQDSGVSADGTPFHARQTQIRGNHVALVSQGRAGPACALKVDGGAIQLEPQGKNTMTKEALDTVKVLLDGKDYAIHPDVAAHIDNLTSTVDALRGDLKAAEELAVETKTDAAPDAALLARVDALESELRRTRAEASERVDARVNLITKAREVLGGEFKTDGVADADIMRAVVLHVAPDLKDRLDANKDSAGYLRASFDAACESHARGAESVTTLTTAAFNAIHGDDLDVDKLRADYLARINGRAPKGA